MESKLVSRVRSAKPDDCEDILTLIKELAEYENYPEGPKIDAETLRQDGFGDEPFYKCFVAEVLLNSSEMTESWKIVGFCLYFYVYSTWEGRSVYMEDLYVAAEYRRKGIGTTLWKTLAKEALSKRCCRLNFAVLDWNKPSIDFYENIGANNLTQKEGWQCFRLEGEALKKFAES